MRPGVAGRDGGLKRVAPAGTAQTLRARERVESPSDQNVIPSPAILLQKEDRLAGGPYPRAQARSLEFHQRHETVHLGLLGLQRGQDPAQTKGLVAERGPSPGAARGGRVTFVEDQVDHFE